jgi:hypothetical protein
VQNMAKEVGCKASVIKQKRTLNSIGQLSQASYFCVINQKLHPHDAALGQEFYPVHAQQQKKASEASKALIRTTWQSHRYFPTPVPSRTKSSVYNLSFIAPLPQFPQFRSTPPKHYDLAWAWERYPSRLATRKNKCL